MGVWEGGKRLRGCWCLLLLPLPYITHSGLIHTRTHTHAHTLPNKDNMKSTCLPKQNLKTFSENLHLCHQLNRKMPIFCTSHKRDQQQSSCGLPAYFPNCYNLIYLHISLIVIISSTFIFLQLLYLLITTHTLQLYTPRGTPLMPWWNYPLIAPINA